MKRNYIIIILIVIAACAVAVVSCNKDKQDQPTSNSVKQAIECESNMDDYLIAFKNKLLSAEKGVESIGMEQAQQDLCNLLNFDFGDANYPTDTYQYDTIHVKLAVNGSQVDLAQLASAYISAQQQIIDSYKKVELPEKSVCFVVCNINEMESRDGETDVEIVVVYRGYIGPIPDNHDTLDWRPKNLAGTCDGQFVNQLGAPEIIRQWLRDTQNTPNCNNGGRIYYTDGADWQKDGHNTYDAVAGRYKIFGVFTQNIDTVCIPHEDMEYYFANALDYWDDEVLDSHIMLTVRVITYYDNDPPISGLWTWLISIYHAKPNCTGTDPIV